MRKFEWYRRTYNNDKKCMDFTRCDGWLVEYDHISFILTKDIGYWTGIECSTGLSVTNGHETRKECDLEILTRLDSIKKILFSDKETNQKNINKYQKEMEDYLHDYPLCTYVDRRRR